MGQRASRLVEERTEKNEDKGGRKEGETDEEEGERQREATTGGVPSVFGSGSKWEPSLRWDSRIDV